MDKFSFCTFIFLTTFLNLHVQAALQCPESSLISPCTCTPANNQENGNVTVKIDCDGYTVNQTTIDIVFKELRRRNEIPQDGWIEGMQEFRLFRSEISELDLSTFFKSQINVLTLERNRDFTKIIGSNNEKDWASIDVKHFQIYESTALTRQGFGDALKYFSKRMSTLYLMSLQIDNNDNDNGSSSEFLPGLFSLQNLTVVYLGNNIVNGKLNGGIFKDLWNLRNVTFRENNIDEIGENVFDFADHDNDDDDSNIIANTVNLDFYGNSLNETSFHVNSGLSRIRRRAIVYLDNNSFATLPVDIFQGYLDANSGNLLYLYGNPFVCDDRLSWIKARREDLERRVYGAYCINDQNKPIFESDLIP